MVDASWRVRQGKMNNLSSVCHAKFMMQLISFRMRCCDSGRLIDYRYLAIVFLFLILFLAAPLTLAQDNYEIRSTDLIWSILLG
jgi:hypothetical protein